MKPETMKKEKRYKCVFFDLDHTLWDYDTNARDTLQELYTGYALADLGIPDFERFNTTFREVNLRLWDDYDRGRIDSATIRRERFRQVLGSFGAVDDNLSVTLSDQYLATCPQRGKLMPHAIETLTYLSSRYRLTVITNGFEDIQRTKLTAGKLSHFFDHVITSQRAGHKKPARQIFEYALQLNRAIAHEAVMVGDNLNTDIGGARNAAVDAAYYNPAGATHTHEAHYEISSLLELCDLL